MICPKCNGTNTKKVSALDANWHAGHERCKDCGHQATWSDFLDHAIEMERRKLNRIVDATTEPKG